jgi:transcriptional regulator with XRE-family HTH domain
MQTSIGGFADWETALYAAKMTSFGTFMRQALSRCDITVRGFSRAVSLSPATISLILSGKRTPPIDRLDQWADVLHLTGDTRQRFRLLAACAHIPTDIRAEFEGFVEAFLTLRYEAAEIRATVEHQQPATRRRRTKRP